MYLTDAPLSTKEVLGGYMCAHAHSAHTAVLCNSNIVIRCMGVRARSGASGATCKSHSCVVKERGRQLSHCCSSWIAN